MRSGTNLQPEGVALDQQAIEAAAVRLVAGLRPGDAVLLHGALGAGKSTFARALLRAAAADPSLDVPSPTYTLVQSYETQYGPFHHFDLWRLDGASGLDDLGWEDARAGVVLVEWPERLGAYAPPDAVHVILAMAGDGLRHLTIDDRRQ